MPANKPYIDTLSQYLPTPTATVTPTRSVFDMVKEQDSKNFDNAKAVLAESIANEKEYRKSWAGANNLNPISNPVAHFLVNGAANLASGLSNTAGTVVGATEDFFRNGLATDIPQEVRDARARQLNGQATAEDIALLNAPAGFTKPPSYKHVTPEQFARIHKDDGTNLSHIAAWEKNQDELTKTRNFFDVSSIVNNEESRNAMNQAASGAAMASDAWTLAQAAYQRGDILNAVDKAASAGKILASNVVDTALDNKAAVAGAILQNAPQLAAGALGGPLGTAITTGAYAIDEYNQSIADYRKEHNGAMPSEDWMRKNTGKAGMLAASEFAADRLTLGMGKIANKAGAALSDGVFAATKGLKKTLAEAAAEEGLGLTQRLGIGAGRFGTEAIRALGGAAESTVGRAGLGIAIDGLGEYGTEAFQTAVENSMRGKDTSLEELHQAGTMGAFASGPIAGVMSVGEKGRANGNDVRGATDEFKDAIRNRDPRSLMGTEDGMAASRAAEYLMKNGNPTPAEKQEYVAVMKEVADGLSKNVEYHENNLKPESRAQAQATLDRVNTALSFMEKNDLDHESFVGLRDSLQYKLDAAAQEKALSQYKMKLSEAMDLLNANMATADEETRTKAKEASHGAILSMISSDEVTSADLLSLAQNTSNALSKEQRAFVTDFAKAMEFVERLKSMDKVNNEVLYGDADLRQKGILTYQSAIGTALAEGNAKKAKAELAGLTKFAEGHALKANAMRAAFEKATAAKNMQVVQQNGKWVAGPLKMTAEALAEAGGFVIHPGSKDLVASVGQEATALRQSVVAMRAAVGMKPTGPVQIQAATQAQPKATQPQQEGQSVHVQELQPAGEAPAVTETPVKADGAVTQAETAPTEAEQASENAVQEDPEQATQAKGKIKGLLDAAHPWFEKLTQAMRKGTTTNPLVKVENFLTSWKEGKVSPADFLQTAPNEKQEAALNNFRSFAEGVSKAMDGVFRASEEFKYARRNPAEYLMDLVDGKPVLSENVKVAMAAAMATFMSDGMRSSPYNDTDAITRLLGQQPDSGFTPPEEAKRALAKAGTRQSLAATAIGRSVVQALGLRTSNKASKSLLPRIEASVGRLCVEFMLRNGMLEVQEIATRDLLYWAGQSYDPKDVHPSKKEAFVRLPYDFKAKEWGSVVRQVAEPMIGTQGVVEQVFSVESAMVAPSFEVPEFKQKKARKSIMNVPSMLAESFAKDARKPYKLDVDGFNLITDMDEMAVAEMAGAVVGDEAVRHKANRLGDEAKRNSLVQGFRNLKEFVENNLYAQDPSLGASFYFTPAMWKPQRAGLASNLVNPQTDKIQRSVLFQESWKVEVDPADEKDFNQFKLRVLEKFGAKLEKDTNAAVLAKEWASLESNEAIQQAADAVNAWAKTRQMTPELQKAIVNGVLVGGEGMASLSGIRALAAMKAANGGKFTTTLQAETDGVTNGPMLSLFLLGASTAKNSLSDLLKMGGFFREGDGERNLNVYRSKPGVQDLYETVAASLLKVLGKKASDGSLDSIWYFLGQLTKGDKISSAGRKFVKTPIAALTFGSSNHTAVKNMVGDLVSKMYEAIEGIDSKAKKEEVLRHINFFLPQEQSLSMATPHKELMETAFTKAQLKSIENTFMTLMAKPVSQAISPFFSTLNKRRDAINFATGNMYTAYEKVHSALRQDFIDHLVQTGQIEKTSNGKAAWDLSPEQEAVLDRYLRPLLPVLHSVASGSRNELSAGLLMMKQKVKQSDDPLYHSTALFQPDVTTGKRKMGDVTAKQTVLDAPGTLGLAAMTHSSDSGISHAPGVVELATANVHDARISGYRDGMKTAQAMNQATAEVMLAYSPMREVYQGMLRTVTGMLNVVNRHMKSESKDADPSMLLQAVGPAMRQYINDLADAMEIEGTTAAERMEKALTEALSRLHKQAYEADRERLNFIANASYVDQYAAEGGEFEVTEAMRADAAKQLEALTPELPKEAAEAVKKLVGRLAEVDSTRASASSNVFAAEAGSFASIKPSELGLSDAQIGRLMNALNESGVVPEAMQQAFNEVMEDLWGGKTAEEAFNRDDSFEMLQFLRERMDAGVFGQYGMLGRSKIASVPALVAFFENNPVSTGKEVISFLGNYLKGSKSPVAAAYMKLLQLTSRGIGDAKVVFVTSETDKALVPRMPDVTSRGWYDPANNTVYVLSPEHIGSGINAEMLLHELTHASLQSIVENPQTPHQKEMVQELSTLLESAKARVAGMGDVAGSLKAGVSNLHEFIAYGLTNRKFQQTVLAPIQVAKTGKLGALISGMQKFINTLASLLFNKKLDEKSDEVDGFTAMLAYVSELYSEASKQSEAAAKQASGDVLSMASAPASQVLEFTTQQVFDALPARNTSGKFQDKLNGLLSDLVNKVHGPFGAVKLEIESRIGKTPLEAWAHARAKGERPFASKALNAAVGFSPKEAYVMEQVEATVRAVLNERAESSSVLFRELQGLYNQAKEALKGKIPSDTYKYVFLDHNSHQGGRSDYLSKFIALGLANEEFNQALGFETRRAQFMSKGLSLTERLADAWRSALDAVASRWTHTYMGQQGNAKLESLVSQLVQVESRYKVQIPGGHVVHEFLERMTASGNSAVSGAKAKIAEMADSDFIAKNKFSVVRLAGSVASIAANGRAEGVMQAISKIRNKHQQEADGTFMALVNFVRGPSQWALALLNATKRVEQQRQQITNDTASIILDSFKDGGSYLTAKMKAGVTYAFLRSGAHSLLGSYGMGGLQELMEKPAALKNAMDEHETALRKYAAGHYYIKQARGLGFYMATNKAGLHGQNKNSLGISQLHGTGSKVPAYAAEAAPVIERLASLRALYELQQSEDGKEHFNNALEVLRTESGRGQANGVEMAMLTHRKLEQDARKQLFGGGNESLMIQGWLPEMSNPHTEFQVVRDPEDAQRLEDQGYDFVHTVKVDSVDPDQRPARMYILRGGGLGRRVSGIFSTTDIGTKGASKHNQYYNPNDPIGLDNMQSMAAIHADVDPAIARQFQPDPGFSPRLAAAHNDFLIPVMNAKGQIVDHRYEMSARNRDTMLERNNSFDHLLGVTAGTTFDKVASREQNRKAVQALKDHFDQSKKEDASDFIRVSHDSVDARMREAWDMMPEATKRDVRSIWGTDGMYVPKDMANILFGYRKYSLAEAFDKENPNAVEKAIVNGVTHFLYQYARLGKSLPQDRAAEYAKRGRSMTRRAEAVWQEIVKEGKDFIVIKGVTVMVGNMKSNLAMLIAQGVPVTSAVKDMFVAWRAAVDYDRDVHALRKLRLLSDIGFSTRSMDAVRAEIAELEDKISRNPVRELVEAGMKPTIVEDVELDNDPYSYKSQLTNWVEEKTSGVHPTLKKAGKFVYMTHDTSLYQFLSKANQYSDFVARYALYKHQTERAKVRLSKEQALFNASEAFVIYDIPVPKAVQYLDDMGITPFIKYGLSIQRVLARTVRDHPLATLMTGLMGSALGNFPVTLDSSYLYRIGNNPFSAGALTYPSSVTEAITMQAALAPIK